MRRATFGGPTSMAAASYQSAPPRGRGVDSRSLRRTFMQVVILGAGPAGLAAAYDLAKRGEAPVVLEKSDAVGGISPVGRCSRRKVAGG